MALHNRYDNRNFNYIFGNSNGQAKVSVTLICCKCQQPETRDFKTWTSDEFVERDFKKSHWLLGKTHNRDADVCPSCMGVKTANKLADRFKTTQDGKPVTSGATIVALHGQARANERDRALAAATAIFTPKAAAPAEVPEMKPAAPAPIATAPQIIDLSGVEQRLDLVLTALSNQTAALDLLVDSMAAFDAREKQAIAATANLSAMIARSQEGTGAGLMQIGQIIRDGQDGMLAGLVQVVQAIQGIHAAPAVIEAQAEVLPIEVDPSVYSEFDPTIAAAVQETEVVEERAAEQPELVDQIVEPETPHDTVLSAPIDISDIMVNPVYSKLEAGTRPYTIIKIEREAFDRTGIAPDSRVTIEYLSHEKRLKIRAVEKGGVKIKMVNNRSVHFQSRGLGDLQMDRALCIPGSNEFFLQAM